ncbi:hypothetical protein K2173_026525 [Erythroxylum novogranatense]|uniref:DYW domain-containing protein n=1 Tax=Erythroxylum novogranatense TaxID=1862640 RepID=A0AAV8U091_9ROSI|nr:hypothetical protein K2173_026525 [Erythroxylum novogranatense]
MKSSHLRLTTTIANLLKTGKFKHFVFNQSYSHHSQEAGTFHSKVVKIGSLQNLYVCNRLLALYLKFRCLSSAYYLFDEIRQKDVRSWTILISGFCRHGYCTTVLELFRRMKEEGVFPNHFTLSSVFKCCSRLYEHRLGKGIHGWILRNGIALDVVLQNSILDFYLKCGAFYYSKRLFDTLEDKDTVSWNIMIGGYIDTGDVERSLELFRSLHFKDIASWNTVIDGLMRNGFEGFALGLLYEMVRNGPVCNAVTFSIALNLVSCVSALGLGKQIHAQALRQVIHKCGFIRNSLIDMYCKCGRVKEASLIFQKMPLNVSCKDPIADDVSRSSLLSGYVQNGEQEYAFQTFCSMVYEQVEMDKFSLTSIVSSCAAIGSLELGQQIHAYILKNGHQVDAYLGSSLIDMYAKCGSLADAQMVFNLSSVRNVVLWTSMIFGCGLHGQGREAVLLFERMVNEKIKPNEISLLGILTACSHAGLVEEGCKYFGLMQNSFGIKPGVEHYTCMVDLYGRAGRLKEITKFINENCISHLTVIWTSFLSSCRLHKSVELGKWVSERLFQLKPFDAGSYVLASNLFASGHDWREAAKIRSLMQQQRVKKIPGQSWIQLKNQVHIFVNGDRSHPQDSEIYLYLEKFIGRLKEIGYSSDVKQVMQDVEEEQREALLGFHSEKLAIVYGIISKTPGTPIRVMKNLRVCTDCHNFIKYTSQLLGREIIMRDLYRFHHFKNGHCSCGDYW